MIGAAKIFYVFGTMQRYCDSGSNSPWYHCGELSRHRDGDGNDDGDGDGDGDFDDMAMWQKRTLVMINYLDFVEQASATKSLADV